MSKFLKTIANDGSGGPYHSFNKDYHLVSNTTKVIIVGTITSPKGRNKGFYYMSPSNPLKTLTLLRIKKKAISIP